MESVTTPATEPQSSIQQGNAEGSPAAPVEAPAPPSESDPIRAQLEAAQSRRTNIQERARKATAATSVARNALGRVVATGGDEAAARAALRDATTESEGIAAALPIVEAEIARLENDLKRATYRDAEQELKGSVAGYGLLIDEADALLLEFCWEHFSPMMERVLAAQKRVNQAHSTMLSITGQGSWNYSPVDYPQGTRKNSGQISELLRMMVEFGNGKRPNVVLLSGHELSAPLLKNPAEREVERSEKAENSSRRAGSIFGGKGAR